MDRKNQMKLPGRLPRLGRLFYCGQAVVHWTLTTFDRATGWLCAPFHLQFRVSKSTCNLRDFNLSRTTTSCVKTSASEERSRQLSTTSQKTQREPTLPPAFTHGHIPAVLCPAIPHSIRDRRNFGTYFSVLSH